MLIEQRYRHGWFYFFAVCLSLPVSCNEKANSNKQVKQQEIQSSKKKPGATSSDSLIVTLPSVVFFEPDSIQLEKIRKISDDDAFKTSVHEYFYMSRNVKSYLGQHRPGLKILEAKNFRYIVFVRSGGSTEIIDLDGIADAWGMYVFDPDKDPQLSDMMNVDTEIPRYFPK
jgi:hypothetical protein